LKAVECGIKAFDIHELLCHFIAKRLGYYEEAGLDVRVIDTTFIADENLPEANYFQVACGAAYLGRRDGFPFKVALAATTKPMFWLHARAGIEKIEELKGKRVATYPPVAPPHWFSRAAIRKYGLDPDHDLDIRPSRDDIIRLGLLRDGDIDAAVISSAISPITVQQSGLNTLTLIGDEITFVTTGIATTEKIMREQPELVSALTSAFQKSLATIHESVEQVIPIISDILRISDENAVLTYERIRGCYTRQGRVEMETAQAALDVIENELGGAKELKAQDLYDFSLLDT
jgi:ABC-type nitrate/sulfonate/bicarbonate transport system substrate-binding protein